MFISSFLERNVKCCYDVKGVLRRKVWVKFSLLFLVRDRVGDKKGKGLERVWFFGFFE